MLDSELDFESKLKKAKEILDVLQNPQITLKESLKAYESGIKELSEAQKMLESAEIKINEIKNRV